MEKVAERVNTLVIGAGKAGQLIVENYHNIAETAINIVGFVDDDASLAPQMISGKPVLGTIGELPELIKKYRVEDIIISIPSGRGEVIRRIIDSTSGNRLSYKIIPRTSEVLQQDFEEDYIKYIRKVAPEDLLGGAIVKSEQAEVGKRLEGQTILITGAAGSIGSELSRQIIAYKPKQVILYDWWENGMFYLQEQLKELHPDGEYKVVIGDIKDVVRLNTLFELHKPDSVFHAAAYKHVPLMEANASEAVKNNILGTKILAELAIQHQVKKFILVSTDKAVNPTNVMGATKRAAEKIIHILSKQQDTTQFCAVRFGNVINSNGSAIPTFISQIRRGGPVTVTHKEITRFFMTISEAVHLILRAWTIGENNDLFVLDMGESVKIYDLAHTLITLEGYIPEEEIAIKVVGLRPGEKLYEEVLIKEEEITATPINKVFRTKSHMRFNAVAFLALLEELTQTLSSDSLDTSIVRDFMARMVSTYHSKHN